MGFVPGKDLPNREHTQFSDLSGETKDHEDMTTYCALRLVGVKDALGDRVYLLDT
jgi:hypothetical protein